MLALRERYGHVNAEPRRGHLGDVGDGYLQPGYQIEGQLLDCLVQLRGRHNQRAGLDAAGVVCACETQYRRIAALKHARDDLVNCLCHRRSRRHPCA